MSGGVRPGQAGFSLLEVIFALLLLTVGLLATAGIVQSAQHALSRGVLIQRGVLESTRTADSLRERGWTTGGERAFPGGRVEWVPEGTWAEGIRVFALGGQRNDTLVRLRVWSLVASGPPQGQGESSPDHGGEE
jgi:prepilin-type N-terminal cleavage/methylation domain-containing protein